VLLPEPLAPSMAVISPARSKTLTDTSARVLP
jgi:hypothetical protein